MSRYTRNQRQTPMQQQPISRSFVPAQQQYPRPQRPMLQQLQQQQQQQQQQTQQQTPIKPVSAVSYSTTAPAAQATVQVPQQPKPEPPTLPKQQPVADVAMTEGGDNLAAEAATEANGDDTTAKPRFPWMKKTPGVRKKPNKKLIQQRLRKHVTPKNATMVLQELHPESKFSFSPLPGGGAVFTAEVEVQGKKFHGVGSNKPLARAAAAEMALQSLVSRPVKTTDESTGRSSVEDSTPWAALASFALHKLFCDWKRGVVGAPVSMDGVIEAPPAGPTAGAAASGGFSSDAVASTFQAFHKGATTFQPPPRHPEDPDKPDAAKKGGATAAGPAKPRKPRELPTNAAERHPVQLLHELHAELEYTEQPHTPGQPYNITVCIDGEQKFVGTARTKKLAKKEACKVAMTALHKVVYPVEMEQAAV